MSTTTAILLTAYNRPRLVADAIASVLEQTAPFRLYILDDGCNVATREAIKQALIGVRYTTIEEGVLFAEGGVPLGRAVAWPQVVWWQGVDRIMEARRATIPYSYTANLALNFLCQGEDYIIHLCDDDYLMPGAVAGLAAFMDAHPGYTICYGRLRAVEFGVNGAFNQWRNSGLAHAGRHWVAPTGRREFDPVHGNGRTYYEGGATDPQTGLDYVEEGYWRPGPLDYGRPHRTDHNQVMYRSVLLQAGDWPYNQRYVEFWGEDNSHGVGDAAFFTLLSRFGPFRGADVWVATKRYHVRSMGRGLDEVRE